MSETVKLIIEIPEELYDTIQADEMISREQLAVLQMDILRGTPLDSNSEQAEVQAYFDGQAYGWEQGRKALIEDAKAEIEKCKEVANVPYDKDYLTTVWAYDDAIRVLDRIGKGDNG